MGKERKTLREPKSTEVILGPPIDEWIDNELAGCTFKDARLGKRFRALLAQLSSDPGESIPLVCQDWANTKAAYRFLANDRVSEADILAGHFGATRARFAASEGPILVLHDTTEFSYKREDIEAVGITRRRGRRIDRWTPAPLYRVWYSDAFEPGGNDGRIAAWDRGHQVLDAPKVQGNQRAQEEDQPDPRAD